MNSVGVLDDLDGVCGELARGDELELGVLLHVLEVLAGRPADVHGLDVGGGEVLGGDGGFAVELDVELAQFAEADAVAGEELLADAVNHVGDDAADGALGERRVVVGDVGDELVEGELVVYLSGAERHGGVALCGLFGSGLLGTDVDAVVNHGIRSLKG